MILNSYIHEQLAAAHSRDLLEAAERARLAAQARKHPSPRQAVRLTLRWRAPRSPTAVEPCLCAAGPPTGAR